MGSHYVEPENNWISTREQLPPYGLTVIACYDFEYVGQAIRTHTDKDGDHWKFSDLSMIANLSNNVTHWQPFPKPYLTGEYPVCGSSKDDFTERNVTVTVTDIDFCKKNCSEYGNCGNLLEDQTKLVAPCDWSP